MSHITTKLKLQGRFNGSQRMRLAKLLDMLYTPAEIASIVGFSRRQFYRVYFPAGCPDKRDTKGFHWVNGKAFAKWYSENYKKVTLSPGEIFCLTCKTPVPIINAETRQRKDLVYITCTCPNCSRPLAKYIKHEKGLR
jgi:hypothetical protein